MTRSSVPLVVMLSLVLLAARADACPYPADRLTYRQMTVQGRTGEAPYRYLLLGRVISNRDLGGDAGGPAMARVAVAAHPFGFAPLILSGAVRAAHSA